MRKGGGKSSYHQIVRHALSYVPDPWHHSGLIRQRPQTSEWPSMRHPSFFRIGFLMFSKRQADVGRRGKALSTPNGIVCRIRRHTHT